MVEAADAVGANRAGPLCARGGELTLTAQSRNGVFRISRSVSCVCVASQGKLPLLCAAVRFPLFKGLIRVYKIRLRRLLALSES